MPMLQEMTERVLARWDRVRRFYFAGVLVHRIEQAQSEHRELLAAMQGRALDAPRGDRPQAQPGRSLAYAAYLDVRLAPHAATESAEP